MMTSAKRAHEDVGRPLLNAGQVDALQALLQKYVIPVEFQISLEPLARDTKQLSRQAQLCSFLRGNRSSHQHHSVVIEADQSNIEERI